MKSMLKDLIKNVKALYQSVSKSEAFILGLRKAVSGLRKCRCEKLRDIRSDTPHTTLTLLKIERNLLGLVQRFLALTYKNSNMKIWKIDPYEILSTSGFMAEILSRRLRFSCTQKNKDHSKIKSIYKIHMTTEKIQEIQALEKSIISESLHLFLSLDEIHTKYHSLRSSNQEKFSQTKMTFSNMPHVFSKSISFEKWILDSAHREFLFQHLYTYSKISISEKNLSDFGE